MKSIVCVVLTTVFGIVICVNRLDVQKMINDALQANNKNYANDHPKKTTSLKTIPYLINVDFDSLDTINVGTDHRDLKFTDFILEAAIILKTYENNVLMEVFAILDDEIGKSVYNSCKSRELVNVKGYLSQQLGVLRDTPAEVLRDYLHNVIEIIKKEEYGDLAEMVNLVNSYYVGENEKFIKVLLALMFKRISPDVNLNDVIRRALRYLFFDHYCNLGDKIRRELILTIEHYWKQFSNTVNNEQDRRDEVKMVSPFDYAKPIGRSENKRFMTINERRPDVRDKNDNSGSYDRTTKNHKVFLSFEDAKNYLDRMQRIAEGQEEEKKSRKADPLSLAITNNDKNEDIEYSVPEEPKFTATTQAVKILQQPDLEKLRNIKALAEEINDMIASEAKSTTGPAVLRTGKTTEQNIRTTGEPKTDKIPNININVKSNDNPLGQILKMKTFGDVADGRRSLWDLAIEFVEADISIVPEMSKTMRKHNNNNENKNIVLSVKVMP